MLSIYKKEFGESSEDAETSANGSPDTLIPAGTSFVTALTLCIFFPSVLENTFHILKNTVVLVFLRDKMWKSSPLMTHRGRD